MTETPRYQLYKPKEGIYAITVKDNDVVKAEVRKTRTGRHRAYLVNNNGNQEGPDVDVSDIMRFKNSILAPANLIMVKLEEIQRTKRRLRKSTKE